MFLDGVTPRDVQQGVLGDCWLLGAICAVATKPEIIEKLFVNVEQFKTFGMVTC